MQGSPPTQPPLALYSGIVTVGPDGNAEVAFDIPAFAGTVRVMAVAWSRDKVGRANGDVIVRDPVVLTATLPRFLLTGDRGNLRLEVDNVEGTAGDYRLAVSTDGPLSVGGDANQTLRLAAKQRERRVAAAQRHARRHRHGRGAHHRARRIRPRAQLHAGRQAGDPGAHAPHRAADRPRREPHASPTTSWPTSCPAPARLRCRSGRRPRSTCAALLKALDRYPFGCSEQITSRALPLLYVNELAAEAHLALDAAVDQRIREAIDRVLARQGSDGSFGLWTAGGEDAWLDAYVTDFLTRARERGFAVPDVAFRLALDRLRNQVSIAPEPNKNGGRELAYALYVLARNGAAPIGDLRYLADTKLGDLGDADRQGADRRRARRPGRPRPRRARLCGGARRDPGEARAGDRPRRLRLGAARLPPPLVTLAAEGGGARPTILNAVARVEAARGLTPYTSTQENAWLVLAARALAKEGIRVSLDVAGEARQGPLYRTVRGSGPRDRAAQGDEHGRCHAAGGRLGHRRAGDARARRRPRLQDRAHLLHARRREGRTSPR